MASLCSRLGAARRCGGLVVPRRGLQNVLSSRLPNLELAEFVAASTRLCRPDSVHVCNGSESENATLLALMQEQGVLRPLKKYHNCWLARTDPRDVARVESRTVLVTASEQDAVPQTSTGVPSQLGRWMSESDFEKAFQDRFPGCMEGRTMYVIPFSMGPLRSPLARFGVQLTDSPYVVASMRTMTRMGTAVLDALAGKPFVKCLHSVGQPLPLTEPLVNGWACDPERTLIAHLPARREIVSFGSGYGGNSLLGKKCFALRIASRIARDEGWLAEHMLIVGVTNPVGRKKYMAAAFPSACGKTNLAMMTPSLPGWKIECVGDDIAWMKFDDEGRLRAINPEAGFFGVAPGTSLKTNPNAMRTIHTNTLFTNVAERSDGGVYWEGIGEDVPPEVSITSWLNEPWSPGDKTPAAHPNSRFCVPASQCPSIDPEWESARGVPIDAIIFGGRRPHGVPLVYQSYDWQHGVFIGAGMRSESTAAAEHKGKQIMHDPFAMRPFFGYNFGDYLSHWLSMSRRTPAQLPKIFHVNWFRRDGQGNFLWPGFGENSRVLEWIFNRSDEVGDEEDGVVATPVGYVPFPDAINLSGLSVPPDMPELLSIPKDFWRQEVEDLGTYLTQQVNKDLPQEISRQLAALRGRIEQI